MRADYGFVPTAEWQQLVLHAPVRLAQGCSGSFVSADGLVMTNHHCAVGCLNDLSTEKSDLGSKGFIARKQSEEVRCPNIELNQLQTISDVTGRMDEATKGKTGADLIAARRAVSSQMEQECSSGDPKATLCQVVTLYQGGRYALYKYRRYQDVRLVFAPEQEISDFGGDPDNFNFPRYGLDFSFLRAYVDNQPAHTVFFKFAKAGPKEGDMTFVIGNPGGTDREKTVSEVLDDRRNFLIPAYARQSRIEGVLWQFSRQGAEQDREAHPRFFGVQNYLKVIKGHLEYLDDASAFAALQAKDESLRSWIAQDPERVASYGDPWKELQQVAAVNDQIASRQEMLEWAWGFDSNLYALARILVRNAAERQKPDAERLPAFRDANLPTVEQRLLSTAPIYRKLDLTTLALSLENLRQVLGADDPLVHAVIGNNTAEAAAAGYINGSHLTDIAVRRQLWAGGMSAVMASQDPMIKLALLVDPEARAVNKRYEDQVQAVTENADETIAHAKFARDGTSTYPDATFTLRLSYGKVQGWMEQGKAVPPFTTFGGVYQRATGALPFQLPPSWVQARSRVDLETPFDFVTTNDIIGGNSGSPVVDREGQVIGLIFDGNIHSFGGNYGYDGSMNRSIAVDTAAIEQSVRVVYHDAALADELVTGARRP